MADITADESVSMGRPVPGVIARVVDAAERVVPVGVSGELWIGGTQVGMGYLDRPELTADRFVTRQARRWYRTGDLVRYRSDGELDFLGRTDDQVKIRGYRIELGEVATALRALPGIADAAAIAHEGRLVGAVVLDAGAELGPTAIRHSLRERVPAFLVPGVVVTLDRLPLLSSGKLDRSAVVAATLIAAEPSLPTQSARPPEGPAEELIAELWAALLGIETVSADDNFFDLGGDSLTASRFVAQLRAMDIDLPLMTIFTHPTVRALAEPLTEVLLGELGVGGD
jgi:aryl carrier-like protein